MKHDLSNGNWVEVCEVNEVTERRRRPIVSALTSLQDLNKEFPAMGGEDVALKTSTLESLEGLNDLLILARAKAWSFDKEITLDNILDLPSEDYDTLRNLCAVDVVKLMPDFSSPEVADSPQTPSDA